MYLHTRPLVSPACMNPWDWQYATQSPMEVADREARIEGDS